MFASGTLKTTTAASEKHDVAGKATLTATGNLVFGVADKKGTNGTIDKPGTEYNFDIGLNTTVSGANVDYLKGNIKVAEGKELSLVSTTKTTIEEGVVFANAGTVTLSGASVDFNADYAAEQNSGKLVVEGTTSIGGAIMGGEVRLADDFAKDKNNKIDDAAFVLLKNGATVTEDGSINATQLTFAGDKALDVKGTVETAATVVSAPGASVTVSGYEDPDNASNTLYGSANLGAITIEDATSAADFTLTNGNNKVDVTAESLTIEAGVSADKTTAGAFTLAEGGLTLNTVSIASGGKVTVYDDTNHSSAPKQS